MRHLRQIPLPHLLALLLAVVLGAAACAPEPFPSFESAPSTRPSGFGGPYGTGTLHYQVSGALTASEDLDLAVIELEPTSARLQYGSTTGDAQYVVLDVSPGLSGLAAAGGPLNVSSNLDSCTFTIDHLDGSGVAGSFDCHNMTLLDPDQGEIGTVRVTGTFDAKPDS